MPRATTRGLASVQIAIRALRTREEELRAELAFVQNALRALQSGVGGTRGRTSTGTPPKRTHNMSAAGRAAIAKAARKRWAAWRAAKRAGRKK
jgi:hypothetical protein